MERTRIQQPLAASLRPRTLDDFVGQETVVGPGTALRRAIEAGEVGSLILWGPPGVGKTSLAYIIAERMQAEVERVSAVAAGVKDLREVIARAQERTEEGTRSVLIVDEIHRFNKAQQDVLLPAVEEGVVTLIGATTENPYFEVVAALVSRAPVVRLEALTEEDIGKIIDRALQHSRAGETPASAKASAGTARLGMLASPGLPGVARRAKSGVKEARLTAEARAALVAIAGGDARRALTLLERVMHAADTNSVSADDIASAAQQVIVQYDKAGDAHYDTISAFIKSLRGSDPDAVLFYLFRMLVAGEDPKFIVRRMFIFASEDIGNADPHALMLVSAAGHALEWVGLPEAEYALAHAAVYLAAAPKSNAVTVAMGRAREDVARHGNAQPPGHITNAPIAGMRQHGRGVGYKYPHDFPGQVARQQYRPDAIQDTIYYEPGTEGFEKEVSRRLEAARKILGLYR